MDRFTYPTYKADLGLCKQQLKEICELCGSERSKVLEYYPHLAIQTVQKYWMSNGIRMDFDLQLAAAFKELQAYRDTGLEPKEISKWIPCSERLPEKEQYREKDTGELIPLLVCVNGTEYPFRAMYDGKTWGDGISKIDVTYWMPLPQPPKGEKQ